MTRIPRILISACFALALGACAPKMDPVMDKVVHEQHDQAVELFETQYSYDEIPADTMAMLCGSYLSLRDYKSYFECSAQCEDRVDTVGGEFMGVMYNPYGMYLIGKYARQTRALVDVGKYDEALLYAKEYLRAMKEEHPGEYSALGLIPALGDVAHVYALKGDRDNAQFYLDEIEKVPPPPSSLLNAMYQRTKAIAVLRALLALGGQEDYQKALAVIETYEEEGGSGLTTMETLSGGMVGLSLLQMFFDPVGGLLNLAQGVAAVASTASFKEEEETFMLSTHRFWKAKCLYEVGRYDEARAAYDELLLDPRVANYGGFYPVILRDRADMAVRDGDEAKAETLLVQSIDSVESYRSTITDDTSKIGFVGDKLAAYGDMISLLVKQDRCDEAFAYAERAKSRALVDMLASHSGFRKDSAPQDDLVAELDEAELEVAVFDSPEKKTATRGAFLGKKQAIRTKAPELASLVTVAAPDAARLKGFFPKGETLVEYYGSGDRFYAFVVTRDRVKAVRISGSDLREEVTAFRKALTDPNSKDYEKCGRPLYDRLLAPLEGELAGSDVTIVPHGPLHYIPFAALPTGKGFAIDRYNIRTLPSASVAEFLTDRSDQPDSLLAFGNPDLHDPSLDLPGAQREVVEISKNFKKSNVFLRQDATKEVLVREGARFKFIHFATHGTFDPDKPLDSGLLLAGDGPTAGMLRVDELYDISLNADLVTLSACETGLGKVSNGDDVVGLSRGFLFAGSSTIVSSLWQVDDNATALLMENMYAGLKKTDKRTALRSAQLYVKEHYSDHPFYWAAFQLTGNI